MTDNAIDTTEKVDMQKESLLQTVYETIKKFPDGISKNQLLQVTGFGKRQISNAVFKLNKKGRIESVERGVYKLSIGRKQEAKTIQTGVANKSVAAKKTHETDDHIRQSVYNEIKKFQEGCTKSHLNAVLSLEPRQLSNALYRLTKTGDIKSGGRGVYIAE